MAKRLNAFAGHAPITVAVGTTIADRPPRRSVRALLRIRLLLWMSGGENVLLAAHRAIPGTCASRSVSDACVIERCSPQSVPFPPRPPLKACCPSLFGWFTGVGSEEARSRAGLRPPLKLHVHISRMQLSRRLSWSEMPTKGLARL